MESICGIDCTKCDVSGGCKGCSQTDGRPFGAECTVAMCCKQGETAFRAFKEKLLAAFRALSIPDMEEATDLHALKGSFVNLAYALPNGQIVKLLDDNKIYLGNQLHKKDSDRCYGIVADEKYLLVAEYGCNGSDAELVVWKRWNEMDLGCGSI